MKRIGIIGVVVAMVALVAVAASASGWGRGPGYGMMGPGYGMMGPGYGQAAPQDQEAYAKFMKETLELRQQLSSKMMELRTLWAQPGADQAQMNTLRNEISDIQKQLSGKANEAGLRNYAGQPGYGPGYGRGYGRGAGNCPGFGGGYRGGNGGGPCGGGGCW
jgi:zinc resistance-associated protein